MKGARVRGLLARGLLIGATAVIVILTALLTWPWGAPGPSPDERRVSDLQRLSHSIQAFRRRQQMLPASLSRLPIEAAGPLHVLDPVTNRPYDYRPLGPLAYELCARFDAPSPEERRGFWWHDAGRYCFSLELRAEPQRPLPAPAPAAPAPQPDPAGQPPTESPAERPDAPSPGPRTDPPAEPPAPPGNGPRDDVSPRPGTEPAAPPAREP